MEQALQNVRNVYTSKIEKNHRHVEHVKALAASIEDNR